MFQEKVIEIRISVNMPHSSGSDEQMFAQTNKSHTGCEATKKRESSVWLQAKRDDKRRASGRSDLPRDDVGLHRRRGGAPVTGGVD